MESEHRKHFNLEKCLTDTKSFTEMASRFLKPDAAVLDVATGAGNAAIAVSALVSKVVATDISPGMLQDASCNCHQAGVRNVEFRACAAECLDVPNESFDGIILRYCLHHCSDASLALREANRVLKSSGVLLMADAFFPEAVVRLWSITSLIRYGRWAPYFTYRQHMDMLVDAGFEVEFLRPKSIVQYFDDFYASTPEAQREILRLLIRTMDEKEMCLMHFDEVGGRASFAYDGFELVARKTCDRV